MAEAVDLYELSAGCTEPNASELRQCYEAALEHYEHDRAVECRQACQEILRNLDSGDGPTKWLLARVEQRLAMPEANFDGVFAVETK
jgi:hypothetical protein